MDNFVIQKREIRVRKAITSHGLDVSGEYTSSAGSLQFDVVIEFGDLFSEIAGTTIPNNDLWKEYTKGHATLLENSRDELIKKEAQSETAEITTLANASSHFNAISVFHYLQSIKKLVEREKQVAGEKLKDATALVALRAGLPMTDAFGIHQNDMVLMDAKRLNHIKDSNKLALGLRFSGDKKYILEKVSNAKGRFINADPALATGSTQLGILLWLLSEGVSISSFTAFSIGAAQQGLHLLNTAVDELHSQGHSFSFDVIAAGIHPTLTTGEHPFYIKTKSGDFAVGDGGDFLDLILPIDLRKRWKEKIEKKDLENLAQLCPQENWSAQYRVGDIVTLENMYLIQKKLLDHKIETPVGELFH